MCSLLLSIVCLLNCLIKAMPDEQTPKSSFQPTSKPTNNPSIVPTALPLGSSCCSNTDCYVTYQSTEDLCFMKAEYPTQLHEGFCWDGDCVPVVGHQGSCQSKKSYDEGCRNAAGHADNNNCVTNLCSSSTNKCEAKSTSGTCLPSHQPTKKPTLKPTPRTTPKPTPKPTQNPTKNPTNPPTVKPTTDPTVYPSVQPTITPTIDPTVHSSTMFHIQPTSDAENGSSWF
eukprot:986408_1